jgi:hypothetical protein
MAAPQCQSNCDLAYKLNVIYENLSLLANVRTGYQEVLSGTGAMNCSRLLHEAALQGAERR